MFSKLVASNSKSKELLKAKEQAAELKALLAKNNAQAVAKQVQNLSDASLLETFAFEDVVEVVEKIRKAFPNVSIDALSELTTVAYECLEDAEIVPRDQDLQKFADAHRRFKEAAKKIAAEISEKNAKIASLEKNRESKEKSHNGLIADLNDKYFKLQLETTELKTKLARSEQIEGIVDPETREGRNIAATIEAVLNPASTENVSAEARAALLEETRLVLGAAKEEQATASSQTQNNLKDLEQKLAELSVTRKAFQEKCTEVDELNELIECLKGEINDLRKELSQAGSEEEKQALGGEITGLQAELDDNVQTLKKYKTEVAAQKSTIGEQQSEIDALNAESNKLKGERTSQERIAELLNKAIETNDFSKISVIVDAMPGKFQSLKLLIDKYQDLKRTQTKTQMSEQESKEFEAKFAKDQQEIESLRKNLKETVETSNAAFEALSKASVESGDNVPKEQFEQIREALGKSRDAFSKRSDELVELHEKNLSLKQDIDRQASSHRKEVNEAKAQIKAFYEAEISTKYVLREVADRLEAKHKELSDKQVDKTSTELSRKDAELQQLREAVEISYSTNNDLMQLVRELQAQLQARPQGTYTSRRAGGSQRSGSSYQSVEINSDELLDILTGKN